jgi:Rad3-related DNA helicase
MQARLEISPQYTAYLAMQQLVQAAGRGSRFEQDRCEVFVVDDCITFFMRQHKSLAPRWFKVNQVSYVPEPGKRAPEIVHISEIGSVEF